MAANRLLRSLLPLACVFEAAAEDSLHPSTSASLRSRRGHGDAAPAREVLDGSLEAKQSQSLWPTSLAAVAKQREMKDLEASGSGSSSGGSQGSASVGAHGGVSEAAFPDDDPDSCRRMCLEEIARPSKEGLASRVPRTLHGKVLSLEVRKALGKMHEEDLQELLRSQHFEMNLLTPASKVNAVLMELASVYISYREEERATKCNLDWKPFACPNGRSIAAIRINHLARDHWKMARMRRSSCMHGFQINWTESVHEGVLAKKHPSYVQHAVNRGYIKDPRGANLGNVGAGLAHITLWEEMLDSFGDDDIVLAGEDNVLFRPESLTGMCDAITSAGDFDILNLAVLRPLGDEVDGSVGLHRARKQEVIKPYPNIWLSSYLVTGRGARKLLECVKRIPRDYGTHIVDHVVSFQCMHGDPDIAAFFVNHYRIFGHSESGGDSRQKYNHMVATVTQPPLPSGAASLFA